MPAKLNCPMPASRFCQHDAAPAQFNGTYWPDAGAEQDDGWSCPLKQEHGKGTIQKGSHGEWLLNEDECPTEWDVLLTLREQHAA